MKAYHGGNASDSVKEVAKKQSSSNNKLTKEESKEYAQVQTASDALKDSADALLTTGSKSLFKQIDITTKNKDGTETTEKGYDVESIYNAVNSFVKNYNSVVNAAGETDSTTVLGRTTNMLNSTTANLKSLLAVGITVNADSTLSLDKDAFMKADMNKVKILFNGNLFSSYF